MGRHRTELHKAAGKLVSAVQKEWGAELGDPATSVSEQVMELAHDLLQAEGAREVSSVLGDRTVTEFLGELWVKRHPAVKSAIRSVEEALSNERAHGNSAAS